ncbi:MAG: amidohydrolase family protein [Halioglobus sp.]|nr:amidohydrolase family protein [Halioglobus sp.]
MLKRLFLLLLCAVPSLVWAAQYDLVIVGGRVIDPETGLDAVRHLGINGGAIVALQEAPVTGRETIDATGLVVAPGFIDLHTHSPTPLGQYYQAFDGVTTALELEAGHFPVLEYGQAISTQPLIHYGASAGHVMARLLEKNGLGGGSPLSQPGPVNLKGWWTAFKFVLFDFETALAASFTEPADEQELARLREHVERSLDEGALGIGLPLDYFSTAIQDAELTMLFEVAAGRAAPLFIHVRRGIDGDPAGLREVLSLARETGASIHICHITHNAMSELELFLAEIREARAAGVDVTTEVLPFNAGSAAIGSAVFGRDWQAIFNITYKDVQWAATGERFTKSMFEEYRVKHPNGQVIHHYLKEDWARRALVEPGVMVVSDLLPMVTKEKKVSPHNAAFSKVLARYVREEGLLDLTDALARMTLLPARRLESFAPVLRKKGRLQPGMDADITIFNAATIRDNATYMEPYREATGIEHVIVGGVPIIRAGELVEGVYPGQRLLAGARK